MLKNPKRRKKMIIPILPYVFTFPGFFKQLVEAPEAWTSSDTAKFEELCARLDKAASKGLRV